MRRVRSPIRANPGPIRISLALDNYPRPEPTALRDLRGRLRGPAGRLGRTRHDPDRELDRRPGRGHSYALARVRRCISSARPFCRSTFSCSRFQAPASRICRTVHSHVHALGQCRNIIRRHELKPVVASDTAGVGARGRRSGRQEPRRARDQARRPKSTGCRRSLPTSRTRRTTRPASSCCRRMRAGRRRATGRW